MRLGENSVVQSAQVALDVAADCLVFTPGVPCRINRYGYIVSVLLDFTQGLILSLDTNDLLASAVRTERALLTNANGAANQVIGTVGVREIPNFTMTAGLDKNVLVPGQQAIVEVKQACTAGDGFVFIEYTPLSWQTALQVGSAHVHYPVTYTG